jgi:hypothetical protein
MAGGESIYGEKFEGGFSLDIWTTDISALFFMLLVLLSSRFSFPL